MDAVNRTGKPRIYIANIMTQPGETQGYALSDHIRALRAHVGDDFPDCVLAHCGELPPETLEFYAAEFAEPVVNDLADSPEFSGIEVIERNFFCGGSIIIRHDSDALGDIVADHFCPAR
jgi:uncharacterized cofD-like protein